MPTTTTTDVPFADLSAVAVAPSARTRRAGGTTTVATALHEAAQACQTQATKYQRAGNLEETLAQYLRLAKLHEHARDQCTTAAQKKPPPQKQPPASRWLVENSWGEYSGKDGNLVMSDQWFDRHVYEVAVHKRHLKGVWHEAPDAKTITLEMWDVFGSLFA